MSKWSIKVFMCMLGHWKRKEHLLENPFGYEQQPKTEHVSTLVVLCTIIKLHVVGWWQYFTKNKSLRGFNQWSQIHLLSIEYLGVAPSTKNQGPGTFATYSKNHLYTSVFGDNQTRLVHRNTRIQEYVYVQSTFIYCP